MEDYEYVEKLKKNYSKHTFNKRNGTVEITIKDGNKIIEKIKFNISDKKFGRKMFSVVMHKYDFLPIEIEDKTEYDWLDLNNDFFP